MRRFSVGAEFLIDAEDEDEARGLVSGFVDDFSNTYPDRDSDVMVQDVTEQ